MRLRPLRRFQLGLALAIAGGLTALLWHALDMAATHPVWAAVVLVLFALNTAWLAAAALCALIGLLSRVPDRSVAPEGEPGPCAVLWLICGEAPAPLAARIGDLLDGLDRTGQAEDCTIFVLSDTADPVARRREQAALAPFGARVRWRNRAHPSGRKPGNLREWLRGHGARFDTMLVLDADSAFSAERLAALRRRMAAEPSLGLLQAAIRLRPGKSRLAAMQRLSDRLSGPVFARGLAVLSGDAGNYWGHNALLRCRAFARIARLPRLPGRAPLGGTILSHDFVEAALLRALGWHVRIDPDPIGSFEDAPGTLAGHLRRDRRWAQGNLQHARLLGRAGLHPASRLHMAAGIHAYLSAPVWLALVVLTGAGVVHATAQAIWPLAGALALLLVPKLAGLARLAPARARGRAIAWRAFGAELGLTTLFAPIGMIRRTAFVGAVLCGRDSGWRPAGHSGAATPGGRAEQLAGLALLAVVTAPQLALSTGQAALVSGGLVTPIVVPLLAAPWLMRWLDAPAAPAQAGHTGAALTARPGAARRGAPSSAAAPRLPRCRGLRPDGAWARPRS